MCAAQALLAHRFRGIFISFFPLILAVLGYGPGIPSVLPLLIQWSNEIIDKVEFSSSLSSSPLIFQSDEYRALARECRSQILVTAEKVIKHRELEYGPIVSGDIATEGSITKPKDIASHSAERFCLFHFFFLTRPFTE